MQILKIATACFVNEAQELLVVRKQNTSKWMLPGGKLDGDETPQEALVRELKEELQLDIAVASLRLLGAFSEAAANEADTTVHAQVFLAPLPSEQSPRISAEIAELRWLPLHQPLPENLAPLLRKHIVPALRVS